MKPIIWHMAGEWYCTTDNHDDVVGWGDTPKQAWQYWALKRSAK